MCYKSVTSFVLHLEKSISLFWLLLMKGLLLRLARATKNNKFYLRARKKNWEILSEDFIPQVGSPPGAPSYSTNCARDTVPRLEARRLPDPRIAARPLLQIYVGELESADEGHVNSSKRQMKGSDARARARNIVLQVIR